MVATRLNDAQAKQIVLKLGRGRLLRAYDLGGDCWLLRLLGSDVLLASDAPELWWELFGLTSKEAETAALLAAGASNKMITQARGVSLETVKSQVPTTVDKLGLTNRDQVTAFAPLLAPLDERRWSEAAARPGARPRSSRPR